MRWVIFPTLALIGASGGCAAPMSYRPGDRARVFLAPDGGEYDLFATGEKLRVSFAMVEAGDPIGFTHDGMGKLVAVGGNERYPLAERSYEWVPLPRECPAEISVCKNFAVPLLVPVALLGRGASSRSLRF